MTWFRLIVDSIFWAFVLQLFYMLLDSISPVNFGQKIYVVEGYIFFYIAAFLVLLVLRMPKLMRWNLNNK